MANDGRPRVDEVLREKARVAAVGGTAAVRGDGAAEPDDDQAAPEGELTAAEMLAALGRLDAEAAEAYGAAAENIEVRDIRKKLQEFERDHRRHLDSIRAALEELGERGLARSLDLAATLLPTLSRIASPRGADAVLLTLLNAEQLTNLTYEDALAYDWDDDLAEMLERNRADEERHFQWLSTMYRDVSSGRAGEGVDLSRP